MEGRSSGLVLMFGRDVWAGLPTVCLSYMLTGLCEFSCDCGVLFNIPRSQLLLLRFRLGTIFELRLMTLGEDDIAGCGLTSFAMVDIPSFRLNAISGDSLLITAAARDISKHERGNFCLNDSA